MTLDQGLAFGLIAVTIAATVATANTATAPAHNAMRWERRHDAPELEKEACIVPC